MQMEYYLKMNLAGFLRLFVKGNNFSDEMIVHFKSDASNNYGVGDAQKWPSMYENATEAWTVSADNINLTINSIAPPTGRRTCFSTDVL